MREEPQEDVPPFFPSWGYWYALVLINLIVLILVFYWFTVAYE